jgi:quinol monooxygenase YgiN
MNVISEKRMELSQTIASLSLSSRMEKGCQYSEFCQSIEDENRFFLIEEWDTHQNLMTHLKSDNFKVIRGTINLLQESYDTTFYTVSHPKSMDEILMDGTI